MGPWRVGARRWTGRQHLLDDDRDLVDLGRGVPRTLVDAHDRLLGRAGRQAEDLAGLRVEPRLLEIFDPSAAAEVRWALVWASGFAGDWSRAARLWSSLTVATSERAPTR